MGEQHDDASERQQRLDALRGLAQSETATRTTPDAPAATQPASAPTTLGERTGVSPQRRPSTARQLWRRWRALALVVVAAVVIFGVVIVAILQNSGLRLGPKPPPALVGSVISLSAAGSLSCPSAPVWSPDGKQLAVIAVADPSPNGCSLYSSLTNIQRFSDASGGGGYSNPQNNDNGADGTSGPTVDTFAIVIFDAASGHVVRTITLPDLTNSVLCLPQDGCPTNPVPSTAGGPPPPSPIGPSAIQSLGWSPDGRTLAVFATYTYSTGDYLRFENRGVLITMPVDGSATPRTLIARGRMVLNFTMAPVGPQNIYSPPRFTWDLTAGSSSYSDIQRGQPPATVPLVGGYRLGNDGALAMDQQAQKDDSSPWRQGVLSIYTAQGSAHPTLQYAASQWLWSPDSRYVLPNIDLNTYLSIPGLTVTPPPDNSGLISEPIITPPDAALNQIIRAAISKGSNVGLARNPDGKLLAALLCAPSGAGQLTIRQVKNGQMVAQADHNYPLTSASVGCAGSLGLIAWSPDGARIATSDGPDGQIIVWRVNVRG